MSPWPNGPPKWCPKGTPNLQVLARKWFWAVTCTIWLRLQFRGRGSAWFFSAHLLYFHAQGQIWEPRIGFWIPRSTFWPGDLFWSILGSRKKWFCDEIILWWVGRGFPKTQMNSIVYRTHLGRLLCPKPWFFNYFQGISRFSGKLGGPWDLPCVFPIPLRATVALFPLFGVYDGVICLLARSRA